MTCFKFHITNYKSQINSNYQIQITKEPPLPWRCTDWEGMEGRGKNSCSPSPHAPHRVHDCPEPNMVQGQPSPVKG